jgi:hypothetical protein
MIGSAASAATVVTISVKEDGGAIHTIGSSSATDASFSGVLGASSEFSIDTISGSLGIFPLFESQSKNTLSLTALSAGDLDIFISVTGLTAPIGHPEIFLTTLTSNSLANGWTVTENTWLDPNNQPAAGSTLGNHTFTGPFVLPQTFDFTKALDTGNGPYAITTEFLVHATGAGTADNLTADVFTEGVPEPGTWALMIMGFGGLGAAMRGRRRQQAAVA